MQNASGFTLVELMIVIAIIGILAAISLPAYQNYTIRARVSEALSFSSVLKKTISENVFSRGGTLDGTKDCVGITNATFNSGNIANITCNQADSSISIVTTAKAGSVTIKLAPTLNVGHIQWQCTTNASFYKYVPAECRHS